MLSVKFVKSLKKIYRLLRIIVHVIRGIVQALYHLENTENIDSVKQKIIRQWHSQFLQLMNIELRIHGDIHPGNHLMVANHISWKDIILLNSIYSTRFVAKSEIAHWPLIGWLSRKVGTLFVKRGNITDIRRLNEQIADLIRSGERVTLFPEGCTGEGSEISHLYPGLFQSVIDSHAQDTGVETIPKSPVGVQPVVIIYKVDEQLSPQIPYTGDTHLLENLWSVLDFDHIIADIYFTPLIPAENATRKHLSIQSQQQMKSVLHKQL